MKRIAYLMAAFLMVIFAGTVACAAENGRFLYDEAGLLTEEQRMKLNETALDISNRYGVGVYIIVLDDYRDYSVEKEFYQAAIDIYDNNGLGLGGDFAGTMLMLSMEEREYVLDFNGVFANDAFSERERNSMEEHILSYLRNNDYYGAFKTYLKFCDQYLAAGDIVGQTSTFLPGAIMKDVSEDRIWLSLIIGGAAAAVAALILVLPMRSARTKSDANSYIDGSLHVSRRSDMFLRRSVTRTPKASKSGGGSGRSYSGGGHSGRSGKF